MFFTSRHNNTMKNLFFATISSLPFFAALIDGRDFRALVFTAVFSILLAAMGKLADFAINYFLLRYTNRPRRDDTTSDH
jgi:hypothetical protein